jgi:hypothetical protein
LQQTAILKWSLAAKFKSNTSLDTGIKKKKVTPATVAHEIF